MDTSPFIPDEICHAALENGEGVSLSTCSVIIPLEIIRHKWAVHILLVLHLSDIPVRFNQLERALKPITQKELSKGVRKLEQAGLIERTVYPEVPPRVDYRLTERGQSLMPVLVSMQEWGKTYGAEIESEIEAEVATS